MERSLWQNNKDEGKPRFLRRWEIFSRSRTSASAEGRIKLPFGSNRILLGSQIRRPCSLAKVSNAYHKSSLFLGVSEELLFAKISNVIANRSFPDLAFTKSLGFGVLPKGRVRVTVEIAFVRFTRSPYSRFFGVLSAEEFNKGQAFYLSVESGIGSNKLILQFACQGNIDGVVDRNLIVKGEVERFLEQVWGWGGNVHV